MKRILIQPTSKILSFILPFAFLTACTTAVVNTTAPTVVSLASTIPAPTPSPAQLTAEKQTATSVPPTLVPDEPSASLTAQPSAMPAPQVMDIRWDTSPTARIIRYYTGPGLAYNINYYIPEAQVWGDGRIIWTQSGFYTPRQVLVGDLTPDQMKALLQHIVDAGFFGWQDHYGLGGSTRSPRRLAVSLIGQSKEVVAYDLTAPSAYFELTDFLQGGAGATGSDFIPTRGYLTARCWPSLEGITLRGQWPDATAGFTLDQVGNGRYIEAETLSFAWQTVNKSPGTPVYVKSNDQTCEIMVQIPGVSFYEPPP